MESMEDCVIDLCSSLAEVSVTDKVRCLGFMTIIAKEPRTGKEHTVKLTIGAEPPVFGKTYYPDTASGETTSVISQLKAFETIEGKDGKK